MNLPCLRLPNPLNWYINVCLLRMNSVDKVKYSTHNYLLRMNSVDNDSGVNHLHPSLLKSNSVNQYVANHLHWLHHICVLRINSLPKRESINILWYPCTTSFPLSTCRPNFLLMQCLFFCNYFVTTYISMWELDGTGTIINDNGGII